MNQIYDIIWSPLLVILLVGAGLYFSIRTRFVQVRRIPTMVRLLFAKNNDSSNGVSSFQAFCMALSGRVGTGNIVGVATAIAFGGAGAIFWMWIIAFLGASTAFMESTLAQIYRQPHESGWRGGPSEYIERGLHSRWLAVIFAITTIIGYGIFCPTVQSNSAAMAMVNVFHTPAWVGGVLISLILGIVIIGGVKRIAHVAEIVTPFMAVSYIILAVVVCIINWRAIPGVFNDIFATALGFRQVGGGILGSTIAMGVKRGLYSNEAGEGGGAFVSASANVDHPAKQGLVQAFSVYIDTLLVCTATAIMILSTGCYNIISSDTHEIIEAHSPELGANYVSYTQTAVSSLFGNFGPIFVTVALFFFVFTTLMAYYFYSESSIIYLARGNKRMEKIIIWIYRFVIIAASMFGSLKSADYIWTLGDIGVGLTTWINVIVILILSPQAIKALRDFESKL